MSPKKEKLDLAMVKSLASFKFYKYDGGENQHILMFKEFEKEVKKKTPKTPFCKSSLEPEKGRE